MKNLKLLVLFLLLIALQGESVAYPIDGYYINRYPQAGEVTTDHDGDYKRYETCFGGSKIYHGYPAKFNE